MLQASAGKKITDPFLVALADREELVRSGKLTTIIFIRTKNKKGQEVSAYMDYAARLKSDNFERYFDEVSAALCFQCSAMHCRILILRAHCHFTMAVTWSAEAETATEVVRLELLQLRDTAFHFELKLQLSGMLFGSP